MINTRCWAYTLPPNAYPGVALALGQVETRAPSPAIILSLMRTGRAAPYFDAQGDFAPRPGDAMSFDDAESAALDSVRQDIPVGATDVVIIPVTDPTQRRFRNCWRQAGAAVPHVDLPLARLQRMTEIRVERDRRLVASDGLMLRAQEMETPPEIAAMKAYRQALRDLPQTTDLSGIATPEALAAFEPTWPVER